MIERVIGDELMKIVHVRVGLAGEPHDERRAERDPGHAAADAREQRIVGLSRPRALHPFEHGVRRVLQRQIDVLADLLAVGHGAQRPVVNRRRVQVEQTDPFEAPDRVQIAQQSGERAAFAAVDAVERGVLRDEQQLLHAARRQGLRFAHDGLRTAAPVMPPERRDDAERALVVASFGDLHVGVMLRRRQITRRFRIVNVCWERTRRRLRPCRAAAMRSRGDGIGVSSRWGRGPSASVKSQG